MPDNRGVVESSGHRVFLGLVSVTIRISPRALVNTPSAYARHNAAARDCLLTHKDGRVGIEIKRRWRSQEE